MVALLTKLHQGTILTAAHRQLARGYMEHVDSAGRTGVGDSSPAGATIALKDGWVEGPDDLYVMNSSGIVTIGSETYIVAAYTMDDKSFAEGFAIVRHICKAIGPHMVASAQSSPQVSPTA